MLGLSSGIHCSTVLGEELIYSENFDSGFTVNTGASSKRGEGFQPSGVNISISGSPTKTVYAGTTDSSIASQKGWVFTYDNTSSSATGPRGGLSDASGNANDSSDHRYLFYESSTGGASNSLIYRQLFTLPSIDLSNYTECRVEFFFHAYGAAFGYGSTGRGLGLAATTSQTSASSASEAGTGLGFTSDTAGGADIVYTNPISPAVVTTKRVGSDGQVQTSGHSDASNTTNNRWIKATADISGACGESAVYVHFLFSTTTPTEFYKQDIAIDSIDIYAL
tara:strand:+ start:1088 stop:1924 length:837 start_codon:yes stop_codon:yes gene_type:complete